MQYALLIYETSEAFEERSDGDPSDYVAAWRRFHESLVASGSYLGGEPLRLPDLGTTVRVRDTRRQIQDGPYANTKEQLGGFILLDLPSLDEAIEWASRCPAASYGAVEVRPVARDMKQTIEATAEATTQEGESR
jgi:hypothetical protein